MNSLRTGFFCAAANVRRLLTDWRVYLALLVTAMFAAFEYGSLTEFAARYDAKVPVWAAAMFFSPGYTVTLFSLITALVFSNTPVGGDETLFIVVRSGRLGWVIGQLLFVLFASLMLTLAIWLVIAAVLLPNISFSNDWGSVIKTVALGNALPTDLHIRVSIPTGIATFSPMATAGLSFLLTWLVAVFIGTMFLCLNSVAGKNVSFAAFGFLLFMSLASRDIGALTLGSWVSYMVPLNFCNMMSTSYFNGNPNMPSVAYCIGFAAVMSTVFALLTARYFCKGDFSSGKDDKL